MMPIVTVDGMAERYGVSRKTARRYLRQMPHMEKPLAAYEWAVDEWEQGRTVQKDGTRGTGRKDTGTVTVPRKRKCPA